MNNITNAFINAILADATYALKDNGIQGVSGHDFSLRVTSSLLNIMSF